MKLLLVLTGIFFTQKAHSAAIFFEPYAGYHFGKYEISKDPVEKGDANGYGAGAKIGTSINGVRVSVEGMYSGLKADPDGSDYQSKDAEHLIYGFHMGLALPGGIQILGGYYLRSNLKVKKNDTDLTEDAEFKGKAYKAGIGFPLFAGMNLNVEYIRNDYKEVKSQTLGTIKISDSPFGDADHESVFVSLSYPLMLQGSEK